MKHRIVPVEPTEKQWIAGREPVAYRDGGFYRPKDMAVPAWQKNPEGDVETDPSKGATAVHVYRAMLSAAEPFEWPEEAVEAAAKAAYEERKAILETRGSWECEWDNLYLADRDRMVQGMRTGLKAALKVVEGRE